MKQRCTTVAKAVQSDVGKDPAVVANANALVSFVLKEDRTVVNDVRSCLAASENRPRLSS